MNKYITIGLLDHANAALKYAAEQEVDYASISGPTEKGWYILKLGCDMLQYERIFGFLEGLEYLQ